MANLDPRRLKRLAKEGGWIIAGQILTVAGTLYLVRILTERLAPAEYGQLALGLTVAGLLNQVIFGGIGNGICRYYAIAAEAGDLKEYLRNVRTLMAYGTLAAMVVGIALLILLHFSGHSQWVGLVLAGILFAVFGAYNSAISGIQNAARQRAIVAIHGGMNAWLKIFFAIAVMAWLGATSEAAVIAYVLSTMVVTLSQIIFLRQTIPRCTLPRERQHDWIPKIWSYSWPFTAFGLFTWMQQVSDRWALDIFGSTTDVGYYAVLFQLGYSPILLVSGMATAFLSPILFQRSGNATSLARNNSVHQLSWHLTSLSLYLTGLGTLLALALHEWLFSFLVASEYRSLSGLLPWFVLAGGLFSAGQTLSLKLMSELKTSSIAVAKIVTALLGIGLNLIGGFFAGILGVTLALVAFSACYLIWMVYLAKAKPSVLLENSS